MHNFLTRLDSTEEPPCIRAWCMLNLLRIKRPPAGMIWKRGVTAQVSSSSSDHSSKLRVLSQNSRRVASKLDANIPKLKLIDNLCC
ncbi:hypothetical protein AVEN_208427-1 [Araneus ventricosus]|uniref:Uncharacterized protein n=1 Tax=Araneus ventricosus TaxID=182803 RepID=A0A4Y2EDQ4_ARAVE|nr:hypothetical protein AVEN_208427-1 [Araneus ventricosus]